MNRIVEEKIISRSNKHSLLGYFDDMYLDSKLDRESRERIRGIIGMHPPKETFEEAQERIKRELEKANQNSIKN